MLQIRFTFITILKKKIFILIEKKANQTSEQKSSLKYFQLGLW